VPPQNPIDRTIVCVSALGAKLAYPDASPAVRPGRDCQVEPEAEAEAGLHRSTRRSGRSRKSNQPLSAKQLGMLCDILAFWPTSTVGALKEHGPLSRLHPLGVRRGAGAPENLDSRPCCQDHRNRISLLQERPLTAVHLFPAPTQIERPHGEDLPMRMSNLVDDRLAASVGAETPLVLFEMVLGAFESGHVGRAVCDDLQSVVGAADAKVMCYRNLAFHGGNVGCHLGRRVRLVVEATRQPCDERAWDVLTNEYYSATVSAGDVETQVDLREVAEAWPADAQDPSPQEVEGNEADMSLSIEALKFGAGRTTGKQNLFGTCVCKQTHMTPICSEKSKSHLGERLGWWDG
jgi:hypothetical protein